MTKYEAEGVLQSMWELSGTWPIDNSSLFQHDLDPNNHSLILLSCMCVTFTKSLHLVECKIRRAELISKVSPSSGLESQQL